MVSQGRKIRPEGRVSSYSIVAKPPSGKNDSRALAILTVSRAFALASSFGVEGT